MPHTGEEMVTGIARIGGLYVGIIANNQQLTPHPEMRERSRPGGILYREGIAKISQFSRTCNSDGIPILWLQDISGFDIGLEAEKHGLLGYGSNLLYTNSTNTVPMITVLLRKASGAGYYAMTGRPYEPFVQLSTPITRLAVMEGRTLAIGAFRTKLDDNFQIITQDPTERAQVEAGMKEVEERIEADMDPYKTARQMDTDEIVALHELRDYLVILVEMCYQSIGYRRVKNPRIWSMHDLSALTDSRIEGRTEKEPNAGANADRADPGRREGSRVPRRRLPRGRSGARRPAAGIYLNPLDRVLTLRILGQRHVVRLPRDVHGRVVQILLPDALTPVAFDQPLLRLDPRVMAGAGAAGGRPRGTPPTRFRRGRSDRRQAPSEGIFYRRPSPDAPPFVEVGARISPAPYWAWSR